MNAPTLVLPAHNRSWLLRALLAALMLAPALPALAQPATATVELDSVPPVTGPGSRFDVTAILDLHITALLDGDLVGDHVLSVELLTPAGHRYQLLAIPFTTADGARPRTRRLPGYPDPVPVQPATSRAPDQWAVTTRLPVAGTSIVTSSLYGRWSLALRLDGQPLTCDQGCTFWLYAPPGLPLFSDGFASGDLSAWSIANPG